MPHVTGHYVVEFRNHLWHVRTMPSPHSFDSLSKAVLSLREACEQPYSAFIRDATIQRFECTFELAWKSIQRLLKANTTTNVLFAKDLFREAARTGIIEQAEPWFEFLKARNLTSHTYNESTAIEAYRVAKSFLPEAEKLVLTLLKLSDA